MKERPILFNAEMVKAILSGRKTQTRRVIKPQPSSGVRKSVLVKSGVEDGHGRELVCPLGQPGDHLWVRETFSLLGNEDGCPVDWNDNIVTDKKDAERIYKASCWQKPNNYGIWSVPDREMEFDGAWTPSIHMPRWASRIQLEITKVGVQRLQEISSGDAVREGICQLPASGRYCINPGDQYFGGASHSAKEVYSWLWESIYGEGSWQANPWVWAIEFDRVAPAGERS
ncbi:hypothetical protein [Rahnella aquatilis]|uniref:hypothetical protein n=1 Tax=Rahnella aquatilis TaxID=34038 RepID=UPI003650C980